MVENIPHLMLTSLNYILLHVPSLSNPSPKWSQSNSHYYLPSSNSSHSLTHLFIFPNPLRMSLSYCPYWIENSYLFCHTHLLFWVCYTIILGLACYPASGCTSLFWTTTQFCPLGFSMHICTNDGSLSVSYRTCADKMNKYRVYIIIKLNNYFQIRDLTKIADVAFRVHSCFPRRQKRQDKTCIWKASHGCDFAYALACLISQKSAYDNAGIRIKVLVSNEYSWCGD